jgi:CheY-like chemotaxis protein
MESMYQRLTSIIVADDETFARRMATLLARLGFDKVEIVSDREQLRGRQTYRRHALIVADGELAADDCSDVLLSARTDPLLPPAAFIVVSHDVSPRFRERCRRRGADAVIGKPISLDRLARALAPLRLQSPA